MKPVLKIVFKAKYSKNPEPSGLNRFQILENWFWNWFIPWSTRKCSLREMTAEQPGMFRPLRGRPFISLQVLKRLFSLLVVCGSVTLFPCPVRLSVARKKLAWMSRKVKALMSWARDTLAVFCFHIWWARYWQVYLCTFLDQNSSSQKKKLSLLIFSFLFPLLRVSTCKPRRPFQPREKTVQARRPPCKISLASDLRNFQAQTDISLPCKFA